MINVKLEQFEGPLSLLLKLIESEKMEIKKVSLAKIADQYIDYIKRKDKINPGQMADFLVIAAKLLYIKSKALLPYLFPEEDEEVEELERQLKMFKEFLVAAERIDKIIKKKKFMFYPPDRKASREAALAGGDVFSPPKKFEAGGLAVAFGEFILKKKPLLKNLEEKVIENKVNIEDKILAIERALVKRIKLSFSEFLIKAESRTEVIVSFLAILELIKQKDIDVFQNDLFTEILIMKNKKNQP